MLTAKPGQQPRFWIDWQTMRGWLLRWGGYSIMRVETQADAAQPPAPHGAVDGAAGGTASLAPAAAESGA